MKVMLAKLSGLQKICMEVGKGLIRKKKGLSRETGVTLAVSSPLYIQVSGFLLSWRVASSVRHNSIWWAIRKHIKRHSIKKQSVKNTKTHLNCWTRTPSLNTLLYVCTCMHTSDVKKKNNWESHYMRKVTQFNDPQSVLFVKRHYLKGK